ncbi:MAG: PEP-CTERM sorting domain-containing protein [Deltaproteobacteria bacterium]
MRSFKGFITVLAVALIAVVGFSASDAHALASVNFDENGVVVVPSVANIQNDGVNATGSGIPIDQIVVSGAPANNGSFDVTGALITNDPDDGTSGELVFDSVAGTLSITGGIPALGIPNGTVLLSAVGSTFVVQVVGGVLSIVVGSGPDTKDPGLLAALGLTGASFAYGGSIIGTGSQGQFIAQTTDVVNAQLPEPATLLLLGSGLAAMGLFGVRRRNS